MTIWKRSALMASAAAAVALFPALAAAQPATAASAAVSARADGVEVRSGEFVTRVTALTDQILRVRVARDGRFPEDASWAVPEKVRAQALRVSPSADGFSTAALRVRVDPATGGLSVEDLQGRVIAADAAEPLSVDGSAFTLRKRLPQAAHIFGLGDKTGGLDRREHSYVDWNTDAYGFSSSTDPIYKSIPFFIAAGGEGGSYGLLLDNTWRTWFDFGHRDAETIAFGGPDGPIDYYLIAGPSTREVVRRYTDLTGKAPLSPLWGLGYQQSRYSYMNAQEVREIAGRLRSDRIPADVLWLDIDFQDRNRPFTVDTKAFPDFRRLVRELKRDGLNLVTITDLHIAAAPNQGYAPYDTGLAGNHFVHNPDGSVFIGPVWPGPSAFPEFTTERSRRWWGGLYKGFVEDGVAGFWNDMNEPALFETPTKTMPPGTVHRIEGDGFASRNASHPEVHNVYGMLNTRATYEGLRRLRPDERPFVMTRASYAGGHRYSITWTGDNNASWDHLRLSVHQLINLGLSGFSYAGADIGGFTGGPSPELLTRWYQVGAFTPVFRNHAAKNTPRAEPWVDGPEHLAVRRRYIEERYRLLPYLYAVADQNARLGDPIMRPVFYDYPAALSAPCDQSMTFTVGSSLLVAPSPKPESPQSYDVCLPAGSWYDYWTGLPVRSSGDQREQTIQSASQAAVAQTRSGFDVVTLTPRLDTLPVYVRAGTILPRQPLVQSTAEAPKGPLSLHVYPGEDCTGAIYADDGRSRGYERGQFARQAVRCTVSAQGLSIDFSPREGRFKPWWREIAVTVHGWDGPARVTLGKRTHAGRTDAAASTLTFTVPDQPRAARITILR